MTRGFWLHLWSIVCTIANDQKCRGHGRCIGCRSMYDLDDVEETRKCRGVRCHSSTVRRHARSTMSVWLIILISIVANATPWRMTLAWRKRSWISNAKRYGISEAVDTMCRWPSRMKDRIWLCLKLDPCVPKQVSRPNRASKEAFRLIDYPPSQRMCLCISGVARKCVINFHTAKSSYSDISAPSLPSISWT
jgi:hypothetical protein